MSETESEERALRDILYDAVGYLSKLGGNLRQRAEHIQSRKMTNTHSVRKTTDKVLEICDLSKKSIVKVEDVVRKGMLKDAQSKDQVSADIRRGGPSSVGGARNSGRVEKTTLRKVGKLHLKIPNEIQLEHFLSCRVKAHCLPRSSLHKYASYLHTKRKSSTDKCDGIAKDDNVDKNYKDNQNSQIMKAASLNDEQTEIGIISKHKEQEKPQPEKSKIRRSSEDEAERNVYTPNKSNNNVSESELEVLDLDDSNVEKLRHYKIPKRKADTSKNVSCSRDSSEDRIKGNSTDRMKTEKSSKPSSEDRMKTEKSSKPDTSKSTSSYSRNLSVEKQESKKKRRHILSISSSDESDREEPPQATNKSRNKIDTAEQSPVLKAISHNIALNKNEPDIFAVKEKEDIPVEIQDADIPDYKEKADIPTDKERADIPADKERADIPADKERADIPVDTDRADIPADKERADIPADKEKADIPVDRSDSLCLEKQSEEICHTSPKPPAYRNIHSKAKEQCIDQSDDISESNNVDSAATAPIDTYRSSNSTHKNDNLFHSLETSRSLGSDKATSEENEKSEADQNYSEKRKNKSRCCDDKIKRDKYSISSTAELKKSRTSPKPRDVSEDVDTSAGRTSENPENKKNTKQCSSTKSQEESSNSSGPNDDVHHILSSSSDDDIESNKDKPFPVNKESEAINKSQSDHTIKAGDFLPAMREESSLSHYKSKVKELSEVETHLLKKNNVEISISKCDEDTQKNEILLNNESTNSSTEQAETKDDNSEKAKPFIKCIDLNKLLKSPNKLLKSPVKEPNSLLLETHSVYRATEESKYLRKVQKGKTKGLNAKIKETFSKIRTESVKKSRPPKSKKIKSHEISDSDSESERTSSSGISVQQRAKELANFKPKQFSINVTTLPSFTSAFLEKHSLTRITQAGSIVAQLASDSSHVQNSASAKTDLLDESSDSSHTAEDQTKSKRQRMLERMRVKQLLLVESSNSDTDENKLEDKKKKENNSEKAIDLLENDKEKNGNMIKKKTIDNHKRKLLASSSSSSSDEDTLNRALEVLEKNILNDENTNGDGTSMPSNEKETAKKTSSDSDTDGGDLDKRAGSKASSISQVDGNDDDMTDDQMGRTTRSRTGSAQNSDAMKSDDKVVDGLSNIKSLHRKNKSRESPSSTSDKTSKKSKGDSSKSKDSILNDDILLKAESKSSSDPESDIAEEMRASSEPNGEAPGELARADLLEEDSETEATRRTPSKESDDASSKSNGRARPGPKKKGRKGKPSKVVELDSTDKDDSDPDEELRVRRRKADVISSGSEAGGSNRKTAEHDSDYGEGSASAASDDSAQLFKRTKRKAKKSSDSDSVKSSTDGNKKKRRRIKQVKDSDASDSDSDNDGKKGGRKNIRKVMGKDQLEEATKKAAREERERMARITERQKVYNSTAFDESGKPDEIKLDKVVLDFDPETKEPLIELDSGIVKKLKPHQANGIKFMWDACFESVKQIKKGRGSGCILAHCMGLGKTLQVVSLTHTLLSHEELTGVRRVLVVCPLSTVLNWVNEFRMWIEHADHNRDLEIYELSRYKQNHERSHQLREWMETGGVCVLGYEMFRNLSADNPKKFRKKMLAAFQESLVNPGPDLVVCDEGHLLKNEKTSLSQSMNRVKTLRRIVLTGTPLQNNLKEYYCMVQFVKPNLLGKYNEYLNRFVNPITNGQYTNSTEQDIRVMKRRSHVLHKMLDGAVQRRDYGVLAPFLPPKHEYVLFITLTEVQIKLYQHYLDNYSRRQAGRTSGFLFPDFQSMQRIWTHPLVLKANSDRYELAQQKKRDREEEDSEGSLVDFLNDESTAEETTTEEETDVSEASDDSRKKAKKKSSKKSKGKSDASAANRRSTRANPSENAENIDMKDLKDPDEPRAENPTEWWIPLVEEKELEDVRNSNKLMLLFDILRQCEAIGDKLLVFSQSLYSLDLIEHFLSKIDEATQMGKVDENLGGHVGSWSPGIDYFRLDGQTSCENRSIWCKNFNKEDNPRARLFLISTRAGGLGINLVAANRVVIFDVSWNPSHDVQSIFRVYRFGQKKPCYVYRFLAMGTMEEKIYERQVTKQAISKRVIDEQQIDRHYNETDLAELYTFQPHPEQPRPVPLLPKDRLFAEMLKDHEKLIYRYHEHDSLLENKEEETLTEEERKAAWEDFENEKNRPPPVPFANTGYMPQMNGMNNLMQQQLMVATMLSVLRKDYPGLSEQQVANILPQLLYDPAMYGGGYDFSMVQKMRALSGMNPAMMAGMGGATSSLGFQPTWQQQQQMQLQRVQQQQALNSGGGGVKYYAGGLGSRDPLSMALQQKQQREMMLSNTGDRLRDMLVGSAASHGGMRAAPLPPPTHTAEVVTLDDSE